MQSRWTGAEVERICRTGIPKYDPWVTAGDCTFDIAAALRAIRFIEEFCSFSTNRWMGQPFLLQPWQVAIVANLFGWLRPDGTRRYRKCLIFVARKQGKSELAGAIANYLLFADGEQSPEIVCAAGNADQAERIFTAARKMVEGDSVLSRRTRVLRRAIHNLTNDGVVKVINSEGRTKHGANLHAALIDELHVHRNAALVEALETSMGARVQPLVLYTTTAGEDPETVAGDTYDYAVKVRDGVVADFAFLPVIYEAPKDAPAEDPATWRAAMPNLGVTVSEEFIAGELREAQQSPRKLQSFKRLYLNQWTEAADVWFRIEQWQACRSDVNLESLKGRRAALGVDLSSVVDTTAIVAAVEAEDGKTVLLPYIFIPHENTAAGRLKRQKRDKAPYQQWVRDGLISATPGDVIDHAAIAAKIEELSRVLNVVVVGVDSAGASKLTQILQELELPVETMRQGWSLAEATRETERMVLSRELVHPGNSAFTWQWMGTALATDRHENQWPIKDRSTRRVDAVVASVMAINGLKFGNQSPPPAVLTEAPELIVIG